MRALRITAPACQDLEEISEYFLQSSVDAGDRFVQTFTQKCQHLARFPYIGKSYAQLRPEQARTFADGLHRILSSC